MLTGAFRGHSVVRRPSMWLLVAARALVLAGAACDRSEPEPPPPPCPEGDYPAVALEVLDEAGEPVTGVAMRYRLDEGPWVEWPENLGRTTTIRDH